MEFLLHAIFLLSVKIKHHLKKLLNSAFFIYYISLHVAYPTRLLKCCKAKDSYNIKKCCYSGYTNLIFVQRAKAQRKLTRSAGIDNNNDNNNNNGNDNNSNNNNNNNNNNNDNNNNSNNNNNNNNINNNKNCY